MLDLWWCWCWLRIYLKKLPYAWDLRTKLMVSLPFISFFLWSLRFYWIWWVVGLSLGIWSYVLVTWTNFCPISYINLDWNCDLSLCYFFLKFQLLHFVPWEIPLGRTHHQTGWVLTRVLTDGMESGAQTPALHPCEIQWKVYSFHL